MGAKSLRKNILTVHLEIIIDYVIIGTMIYLRRLLIIKLIFVLITMVTFLSVESHYTGDTFDSMFVLAI